MTNPYQYTAFVMARLIGGLSGGRTAAALGADTIVDLYFLHQRGKGLAMLNISFLSGGVVGQALNGYISGSAPGRYSFGGVTASGLISSCCHLAFSKIRTTTGEAKLNASSYASEGLFANSW